MPAPSLGSLQFHHSSGHVPKRRIVAEPVESVSGGGPDFLTVAAVGEPGSVTLVGFFATVPDWDALKGTVQTWAHHLGHTSGNVFVQDITGQAEAISGGGSLNWMVTVSATLVAEA
jgi:hypothetical protein